MLQYSELTVVKNTDGLPSALGIPINSFIMKNDMLSGIFSGGGGGGKKKEKKGKKEKKEKREEEETPDTLYDENLAVPMGLVCKTETVCRSAPAAQYVYEDANTNAYANANANAYANANTYANTNLDESDIEIVPDSLYNKLLDLLNMPDPSKKMTRRVKDKKMAHGSSKPAHGSSKPAQGSNKGKKTRRNNKK